VADGAPWIWNVVADRWARARQLLDFYHASQHLWALGEALHRRRRCAAKVVERRLHQLRHGKEKVVLRQMRGCRVGVAQRGKWSNGNKTILPPKPVA